MTESGDYYHMGGNQEIQDFQGLSMMSWRVFFKFNFKNYGEPDKKVFHKVAQ